jgi:hypothetical protein
VLVGLTGPESLGAGSPSSRMSRLSVGVWRWVEHNFLVHEHDGLGTLLGPEGTLVGVFLLASGPDRLTPRVVGVVVVVVGWGVVVC